MRWIVVQVRVVDQVNSIEAIVNRLEKHRLKKAYGFGEMCSSCAKCTSATFADGDWANIRSRLADITAFPACVRHPLHLNTNLT